jgi:predicted nucleic acid-binding protein
LKGIVVDASVALAWCFPDEHSEYADDVLDALEGQTVVVPSVWALEVANAVLVAERRKRIGKADIVRFVALLGNLSISEMSVPVGGILETVIPLAREHGLSAYDAAYLDVAVRTGSSSGRHGGVAKENDRKKATERGNAHVSSACTAFRKLESQKGHSLHCGY